MSPEQIIVKQTEELQVKERQIRHLEGVIDAMTIDLTEASEIIRKANLCIARQQQQISRLQPKRKKRK